MAIQDSKLEKELPTLEEFLINSPPGSEATIKVSAYEYNTQYPPQKWQIALEELQLFCKNESCKGIRFFEPTKEKIYPQEGKGELLFLSYQCKNCEDTIKIYPILFHLQDSNKATIVKIGEWPSFGTPTPTRLLSLVGSEKDYFLKGRRAENQGLGIGAFAYYRRVVENQKNRIFDEIIKVVELTKSDTSWADALRNAKNETQFTKAVESLKGGIPDSLLIDGHNPLTLLHSALSEGLHAESDEDCLEFANTIRIVLSAFAERIGEILKDQSELKQALSKLLSKKTNS